MGPLRLRRNVQIGVEYDDRTAFGSPVGERIDAEVRALFAPLVEQVQQHGFQGLVDAAPALLANVVGSDAFSRVAELDGAGAWRIRPEILYPELSQAPPRWLSLSCADSGKGLRVAMPLDYWPRTHALIALLAGSDGCEANALDPEQRTLLAAMQREDLVEEGQLASDPRLAETDVTFLGHNTVVVRSRATRVLADPFLLAGGSAYPADYQPLQLRDVGPIDTVLITHSHRDHFDAASLLQFPPQTRIVIPRVERETLLAVAMEQRLRELGFSEVLVLDWGQAMTVGDVEVHALPFYGEQPTEGEVLHPEVRNMGNTYLVRTPTHSSVFLADSRRDGLGDAKQVGLETRASLGPADVVFSGYRGWYTYTAQLLFSSIARFLLFVPPHLWGVRQQLMSSPEEAVDNAECWGARFLVPYADGGAPWHWGMGLGPRLDEEAAEFAGFDPFPERVLEAAHIRTQGPDGAMLASGVRPLLLRPCDSVRDIVGACRRLRLPGHTWPYRGESEARAEW
jgi:L-ascorbate metabolism protein UlaG (beta-lactamase superfamily)